MRWICPYYSALFPDSDVVDPRKCVLYRLADLENFEGNAAEFVSDAPRPTIGHIATSCFIEGFDLASAHVLAKQGPGGLIGKVHALAVS